MADDKRSRAPARDGWPGGASPRKLGGGPLACSLRRSSGRISGGLLMAGLALLVATAPLRAAFEGDIRPSATHRPHRLKDIRIPIPGWSRDVEANGCHARPGPAADAIGAVPFWTLVEHSARGHVAKLTVGSAEIFLQRIAALDDDMRRLVLLYTLHDSWGRDGLHTFFYMDGGAVAPAIRDALDGAELRHEHDTFARAMAQFGEPYPVDNKAREKFLATRRPTAGSTLSTSIC
jgi:hypothetical protein